MYIGRHVKCPLFLPDFNKNLLSLMDFQDTLKYRNKKILPFGGELFHADGQTDRHDEANTRFSQFCESVRRVVRVRRDGVSTRAIYNNLLSTCRSLSEVDGSKTKTYWESILLPSVNPSHIVKSVHMPLCSPQIQNVLTSAVKGLKITA
jgi:hypothetical protein